MFNTEVRDAMKKARLYGYEVAAALNMSESSFSRKLARQELREDEKNQILDAIAKLTKEVR